MRINGMENKIISIKLKYLPEKWLLVWVDESGFEHCEYFDQKEEALHYRDVLKSDMRNNSTTTLNK